MIMNNQYINFHTETDEKGTLIYIFFVLDEN